MKRIALSAVLVALGVAGVLAQETKLTFEVDAVGGTAQDAQAPPSDGKASRAYDVVSVRPRRAGERGGGMESFPGRLIAENMTPSQLIQYAHQVRAPQLLGAPRWATEDRFDVELSLPAGVAGSAELFRRAMGQALADRFGLVVHRDMRDGPVAILVRSRRDGSLGPALKQSTEECSSLTAGRSSCFKRHTSGRMEVVGYEWSRIDLPSELLRYGASEGLMVVDRTGLEGRFDFMLHWVPTPEFRTDIDSGVAAPTEGVPLAIAIRERLGLELRRGRAPVEYLVIDRISRPQPN